MRRRVAGVAAAVLAGVVGLSGCRGGEAATDGRTSVHAGPGSSASSGAEEGVTTQTVIATVTGRLAGDQREALTAAITGVVDGWLDGAYLGDFPRADFSGAFSGFTAGAAAKAQRDLALMSNAAISDRIRTAEATRRSVSLDVLAVRQRPVGVTARIDVAFETTGTLTGPQQVAGTLDLTPVDGRWKVFGFDVTRTPASPADPAASPTPSPESDS
jgi:hypothetical protein